MILEKKLKLKLKMHKSQQMHWLGPKCGKYSREFSKEQPWYRFHGCSLKICTLREKTSGKYQWCYTYFWSFNFFLIDFSGLRKSIHYFTKKKRPTWNSFHTTTLLDLSATTMYSQFSVTHIKCITSCKSENKQFIMLLAKRISRTQL